ncbi:C40 family peptidase [Cellulophaga sp. HaHaR_3_176]|uniref:C40 family peptidase n=1 Tax=Cellulophaga sp. HaHaR_3_176 TaxID=1942464 RepID=UPI001C1FBBF5|nr:NlpC/P60 family protein [Cellulophaga sp. HaHaR_3_176]QWX83620.1 C40 family peptidase [Cellulophaga sp. HaHaR_3_176]
MFKKSVYLFFSLTVLLISFSCSKIEKKEGHLVDEINEVKNIFAPDKRVALFSVTAEKENGTYTLKGESNLPDAVQALKDKLNAENKTVIDSITMLPTATLNDSTVGLVSISVANLRSNPKHSAELATQALLGTPVKIYKKEGSWALIQTPDMYLSWVDDGGIVPMPMSTMNRWKAATKIIYTQITGNTYSEPNISAQVVSDIVAGGILEMIDDSGDFYNVKYPDGRVAFVNKQEAVLYSDWLAHTNPTEEALVATSKKLMGLPYLWGGTSPKGVDCSGFTKTIYFLNGMIIPRDASQQVHTGEEMDAVKNFDQLAPGDLLFFGRKATDSIGEKVVHVGMWIGNNEFIHSSGQVKISSVAKDAYNFDAYNLGRYLRSKRLVNSKKGALINLTKTPIFND